MSAMFLKQSIRQRPFTVLAAILLELIGLLHIVRLFTGWDIAIADATVPVWSSAVVAAVLLALAGLVWWELWRSGRYAQEGI
ncbi:MAG: hypothetical protein AAF657_03220 [Acidobacteriota bacterium]